MSRNFDMNTFMQQHQQQQASGNKKYKEPNQKLIGLEPFKDGEKADNYLYVNLLAPAAQKIFRGTAPEDYWVWFMRLKVHSVRDVIDPMTGLYERQNILCPKEQNIVALQDVRIRRPVVFAPIPCHHCGAADQMLTTCANCATRLAERKIEDRCPSCEEAEKHWSAYNKAWEDILPKHGLPPNKKSRYQLKRTMEPLYRQLSAEGTPVGDAQKAASEFSPADKYFMVAMDYGKLTGVRRLREKEDAGSVQQGFLAGQKIYDALASMCANGTAFFDLNNPQIIVITKDTARGTRYANMIVTNRQLWQPFSEEMKAYMYEASNAPDILEFMQVISYNVHAERAKLNLASESVRPVFAATASVPAPPPAVGSMPAWANPTAPVPFAPPMAAPPMAAPPMAPPMAAPPMAPPMGMENRTFGPPPTPGLVGRGAVGMPPQINVPLPPPPPPPGVLVDPQGPPSPLAPPIPSGAPPVVGGRDRRSF